MIEIRVGGTTVELVQESETHDGTWLIDKMREYDDLWPNVLVEFWQDNECLIAMHHDGVETLTWDEIQWEAELNAGYR